LSYTVSRLLASILALLSLGIPHGEIVTLSAEGSDADTALNSLAELLASNLDTV
jgi:phosphocarrier protein HPr